MGKLNKALVCALLVLSAQAHAQSDNTIPLDVRIALAANRHADALPWLHDAADQGHSVAALTLGKLYRMGKAVPRDIPRAISYLQIAEQGGATEARRMLAQLSSNDKGKSPAPRTNTLGNTPLHVAVLKRDVNLVRDLIRGSASINARNESGDTPLHIAAASANTEICQELIHAGADLEKKNAQGWSAATIARRSGDRRLLKIFNLSAVAGENTEVGLRHAVRTKQLARVRTLLANEAPADPDLLLFALSLGHAEVAQALAAARVGLQATDRSGRTALHLAALAGNVPLIDTLLEVGADPQTMDNDGHSPLFLAARAGAETAALRLARRTDDAPQALWLLSDQGAHKAVDALLKAGVAPSPDKHPIFAAAAKDHVAVLKLFGAATHGARTRDGTTALMVAAHNGSQGTIAHLIDQGTPLDTLNNAGNTALLIAAQAGQLDVCRQLIDAGASLGIRNHMNINARSIMENKRDQQWQALLASTESGFFSNLLN